MNENVSRVLIVINDAPYGSEWAYNALRLAMNLGKRPGILIEDSSTERGERT